MRMGAVQTLIVCTDISELSHPLVDGIKLLLTDGLLRQPMPMGIGIEVLVTFRNSTANLSGNALIEPESLTEGHGVGQNPQRNLSIMLLLIMREIQLTVGTIPPLLLAMRRCFDDLLEILNQLPAFSLLFAS